MCMCVYIYICMYVCMYVCMYIYIYIAFDIYMLLRMTASERAEFRPQWAGLEVIAPQ